MVAALVAIAVALGLIPAVVAHKKGQGFFTYWLFGAALLVVALPVVLLLPDRRRRPCPFCAERVPVEATVCGHCRSPLVPVRTTEARAGVAAAQERSEDLLVRLRREELERERGETPG